MTAEIAILNRQAVALAADSAVTLQTEVGPPKIYDTNKLFSLSKYQPVAAMVYGNAEFMDVPWEVAIKAYRAEIATRSFGSLQAYGQDFLRFLERTELFPKSQQEAHVEKFIAWWLRRIKKNVKEKLEDDIRKGTVTKRKLRNTLSTVIKEEARHLRSHKKLPQFGRLSTTAVLRRHHQPIRKAIQNEISGFAPDLINETERVGTHVSD
jgi:hypothetical protein